MMSDGQTGISCPAVQHGVWLLGTGTPSSSVAAGTHSCLTSDKVGDPHRSRRILRRPGHSTNRLFPTRAGGLTIPAMNKKPVAAAILWIYSCSVAGGVAEFFIGTPALLGLAVGIAAAVFFGLDPFGVVWPKTDEMASGADRSPSVETGPAIGSTVAQ